LLKRSSLLTQACLKFDQEMQTPYRYPDASLSFSLCHPLPNFNSSSQDLVTSIGDYAPLSSHPTTLRRPFSQSTLPPFPQSQDVAHLYQHQPGWLITSTINPPSQLAPCPCDESKSSLWEKWRIGPIASTQYQSDGFIITSYYIHT
jgi:hypothetical protein